MRRFVVGGAGFIGTNYARTRTCTIYDLQDGNDAHDLDRLTDAMRGHDLVVHLAANADISLGADDPNIDLDGIDLTRNVCDAARAVGVRRVIYTSGSGVYGAACPDWPTEQTACTPTSPYGASKLASEAVLHAYERWFEVVIFRPGNVVGPDQTHGVGFDFVNRLRDDPTRLRILGDGKQSKQYLHVEDLIAAFDLAPPGTWNVAPFHVLSVEVIADMACARLGLSNVRYEIDGGLAWPGDIPVVRLDSMALWRLGWRCLDSAEAMSRALAAL